MCFNNRIIIAVAVAKSIFLFSRKLQHLWQRREVPVIDNCSEFHAYCNCNTKVTLIGHWYNYTWRPHWTSTPQHHPLHPNVTPLCLIVPDCWIFVFISWQLWNVECLQFMNDVFTTLNMKTLPLKLTLIDVLQNALCETNNT